MNYALSNTILVTFTTNALGINLDEKARTEFIIPCMATVFPFIMEA